ncbi:SusC/RagA family TonB-linked outer membrane protein [Flavivirga spongiicola]|uniref:TonB-dependent receptor n=1 Tax=Flavivirga spongiicola TaxID=421621 RepID=A0ABU7XYS8_9FLAO|nr:TonB-dependent receptor [Flavivirga sp. MEBiC05379]MDO5980950.1 TonB-dependent receptor [Flavivirga sp. MEBiC05379]
MKQKLGVLLLFLLITSVSLAQQTIIGLVTSTEDNQPLPGVTILLKGTTIGATTDFDGNFSIEAPSTGILVFSYVGYLTQEISINNQIKLSVILQEDVSKLDEVVVVGYGTQKKSDITGAVTSVKVGELTSIPLARTDEVLQGQVAGVQVNSNDASPNSNVSIRIRGVSSINGGNNPLVIVDGTQGVSLSDIHPNDIKSMEVLKDASATAIYGSRGASGVILITTKKGRNEKPTLTYNGYTTLHSVREKLDLMNASQYAQYINRNRVARGLAEIFSSQQLTDFAAGGGTDWQDEIFKTGTTQNHHLTIGGGTDNVNYNISGDFIEAKGIIIGSNYKKFSGRVNIGLKLSEKLKVNINSFTNFAKDNPTVLNTRDAFGSPVYASLLFSPTKPILEADGSYSQPGGGVGSNTEYNPVALALEPIRNNYSNTILFNPSVEYKVFDALTARVGISYQLNDSEDNFYYNERVVNGDETDRQASIGDSKWSRYQNTNILTYEKLFNEKHSVKLTGVFEQQSTKFNSNFSSGKGFLTNAALYNALELGSEATKPSSYAEDSDTESYMGRLNYAFDNRYSVTLTYRADHSSVFATNNKWGYFPSAGFAWNISNEKFLENTNTINSLKLRGSYGEVGNQAIGPYQSLDQLRTGSNVSFNGGALTTGLSLSTQAGNPNLKWETTEQLNIGLDLGLFNGRLSLSADYYKKNTTDLLLERQLFQASGFQTQLVNAGEVENKGFEIALSGKPIVKGDFAWGSNITFTKNDNEVIALNSGETELSIGGAGTPGFSDALWLEVGQPIGLIRGFEYDGVWKSDEAILAAAYDVTPGSPKYVDQNNDGVINGDDVVNIAKALPDYTFGWNNTFTYNNLSLNVFIIGVQGNDILNIGRFLTEGGNDGLSTALLNRWTPTNENTNVPGHDVLGNQRNSSRWVEDGSYIRVKNITLGYNLPNKVIQSLKINSAKVYFTGTNLFTFTDYSGYDPESNNSGGADAFAGVDTASYPSQKKFTIGLDIKF